MNVQYTQEQAKYRVSIKRQLRQLGCTAFHNEESTELLEAKLAEVKQIKTEPQVKMSATEKIAKISAIFNPIREQVEKEINAMTLDQLTIAMKAEGLTHRRDLVSVWAKRRAVPVYKMIGLA